MKQKIKEITELSHLYGKNLDFVYLGGGNTSVKNEETLYIKPSGQSLAKIEAENFLAMDRKTIDKIFTLTMPDCSKTRESIVTSFLTSAVRPIGAGRPSVEAALHNMLKYTYVVHLHPVKVNGMTCAKDGAAFCRKHFPEALWVNYCDPGYTLACAVKKQLDDAEAKTKIQPQVIFLQNHGVFVASNSPDEIKSIYKNMIDTLDAVYDAAGIKKDVDLGPVPTDKVMTEAPALRAILGSEGNWGVVHCLGSAEPFGGALMPDSIVYGKALAYNGPLSAAKIKEFESKNGFMPKIIKIKDGGLYVAGADLNEVKNVEVCLVNSLQVERYAAAFGGVHFMEESQWMFIVNWESESYRKKMSDSGNKVGARLANRLCLVTGGAQGFGYGISDNLVKNGGIVIIADMNVKGAQEAAQKLCDEYGENRAIAVGVNISDEDSVKAMTEEVALLCGGLDLLVANAGVVRAGSVMEMTKKDWDFVTSINYVGYFLCVKHIAKLMKNQAVSRTGRWSDIVQINSKSGLEGSNKNGAYAGSKFGTIGLTQSFAKELVTSHIKVNSVCPGNYLDGPLWTDPERGLFVQYLKNGKVPGAKTLADVREFYEAKVPMHRGCLPSDVTKAVMYCVEQNYETGQAIPVTGGQVMLH